MGLRKQVGVASRNLIVVAAVAGCADMRHNVTPRDGRPVASAVIAMVIAGNAGDALPERSAASTLLVGRCMRRQGFAVVDQPVDAHAVNISPALTDGELASVPDESTVLAAAARSGFEITNAPIARLASGRLSGSNAGISSQRRYVTALIGPRRYDGHYAVPGVAQHVYPTGGCAAEADRVLYGSAAMAVKAIYLPEDLELLVARGVYASPAYHTATRRWSECFRQKTGLKAAEPYGVAGELLAYERKDLLTRSAMPSFERGIAVVDARCQYRVGFIQLAVALRQKYATIISRPYRRVLVKLVGVRARATRRAEALLNGWASHCSDAPKTIKACNVDD